jgi:hypothetical protein
MITPPLGRGRFLLGALGGTILALVATGVAPEVAPAEPQGDSRRCELRKSDSVYLARGPVYRDCAVDRKARRLGSGLRTNYSPRSDGRTSACFWAEIEFAVDSSGRPETDSARVVQGNDRQLGHAMLEVLSTLRYEPAQLAGVPVRQIVREKQAVQTRVVISQGGGPPPRPSPPLSPRGC